MSYPMFKTFREFCNEYEMPLARALFHISNRGLLVDDNRLGKFKKYVQGEIDNCLDKASTAASRKVVGVGYKGKDEVLKIASPKAVADQIKKLGIHIPKSKTAKGWVEDATKGATLQRIFSKTGNEFVWQVIRFREMQRMMSYANITLLDNILYSTYKATGTVGGRRSSSENFLGLGTNGQNLPKHSKVGMLYRSCIVARPGKIFIWGDQKSAEDWIVHGIIADVTEGRITTGIDQLLAGINRHRKLASKLFGKPEEQIDKAGIEYFLGKKTRHAGHYGMRGQRYSDSLAEKGIHLTADVCDHFLKIFHQEEPQIEKVFQKYVETELTNHRSLTTPIGRGRDFFALRNFSDNSSVFRDAYSYIPQSTVGDNTGLSILWMETNHPGWTVADHHDALGEEVDDSIDSVVRTIDAMQQSMKREIEFPKGFKLTIPSEFEIGYDLGSMVSCDDLSRTGLTAIYNSLDRSQRVPFDTTFGVPQPSLQQA